MPNLVLLDFPASKLEGWESLSPFVLKIIRALRYAGLPFQHEHLPLIRVPTSTPHGQLPVLHLDGEVLADSTNILLRIERELAPGVFSRGLDARAQGEAWLWEEFADTSLYAFALSARWYKEENWQRLKPAMFGSAPALLRGVGASWVRRGILNSLRARDFTRAGLEACYARMRRTFDDLEARTPRTGFWVGETLSVADVSLFAQLHTLRAPFSPDVAEELAARKNLSAYLDRVDAATR
ncbi:MAG TPA: glutathione S-transferase family protein [Polyangiales bacterium]